MLKTTAVLLDELKDYANPAARIKRLADKGELTAVVRGLYETDKNTPGYCLASAIYGPSYLSFEFALAFHSLIPEAAYTVTCATFGKKKAKLYHTPFGTFTYRDVPGEAYPYGVELRTENGYSIALAAPEKALCDLLYTITPRGNQSALRSLLFDDLRIAEDGFDQLNMADLLMLAGRYHTANHKLLKAFVRRRTDG
jgi:predicted transcriptional regulator of viral defense system